MLGITTCGKNINIKKSLKDIFWEKKLLNLVGKIKAFCFFLTRWPVKIFKKLTNQELNSLSAMRS